jgi:hypothetical protein
MYRVTGRDRPWDLDINGYPFEVVRDKNGVPNWAVPRSPDIAGQTTGVEDIERSYRSCHSGFGWSQYSAPNTYHYCTNMDARYPSQITMGPLVTAITQTSKNATVGVTGFFEYGSYLYTLSGRYCNRIDPSSDTVASAGGFPYDFGSGTVATMGMRFDANVLIGFTGGTVQIVKFDGTNFTADDDSLLGAYFTKFWADTDYSLVQSFLSGNNPAVAWLAQTAEPFTIGNWAGSGGDYKIGDAGSTINSLAAIERTLFAGKTDGLYYLDGKSGRSPCLVPAVPTDSTNGLNMIADSQQRIWYPAKSGLYLYDSASGAIDDVSPGRGLPDRSGIQGLKTAIATFRSWTFVSVYDGTSTYIMAGRQREDGEAGYGPYIWHGALAKIVGDKVTSMHVSSLVSPPRLWFGLKSGDVSYIILPSNGDNPLNDSLCRYAASGSIYFSADDYGISGMRWNLQNLVIETEGVDANTTVAVYERRDLNSGTAQVETATVLGAITGGGAGNATVIVTAANMTGSPRTVSVAVANSDSAILVAGKIRVALAADPTVGGFFSVSGTGANVILTVKNVVADDNTMNISIANGSCSGLTTAGTSTSTTAGVNSWSLLQTITTSGRTLIKTTGDKRFNRCELRLDVVNAVNTTTPVIRMLVGRAARRPTMTDIIRTSVLCTDSSASRMGVRNRYSGKDLLDQLDALQIYYPFTLKTWWTGSETSQTVLLTSLSKRVVSQQSDDSAALVADLEFRVVS